MCAGHLTTGLETTRRTALQGLPPIQGADSPPTALPFQQYNGALFYFAFDDLHWHGRVIQGDAPIQVRRIGESDGSTELAEVFDVISHAAALLHAALLWVHSAFCASTDRCADPGSVLSVTILDQMIMMA
jgi:hypothetical protein